MIESAAVRYFREVTECGSIKQAAASLRIAPSAISRQVQTIEEELSVKLFERGARGMVLTDAASGLWVARLVRSERFSAPGTENSCSGTSGVHERS